MKHIKNMMTMLTYQTLLTVINYLNKINQEMALALYNDRPEKDITKEESDEKWNETIWHKIIMKEIKEIKDANNF